jgi:hypothetical protein
MATPEQRIADLEAQVAELSAVVRRLALEAATIRTLEEMFLARRGGFPACGPGSPAASPARRGRPAVKAALIALVLTITAPLRLGVTVLGFPVSFPAGWLILAVEVLAVAALAWLAFRVLRRFRSSPWLRTTCSEGGAT